MDPPNIGIARIYEAREPGSRRVLVDRLWPRGISKAGAPFDGWMKDVAPSSGLRKWYGHDPGRFEEFERRYLDELTRAPAAGALDQLRAIASVEPLVLVTATKDLGRSGAAVLRDVLSSS